MKNYLCLIFLHTCVSYGQESQIKDIFEGNYDHQRNVHPKNNNQGFRRNYDYQKYDNYEEEYIGNPDIDAQIERPCPVYDLNCIREFFAEHSKCKIRRGPLPKNVIVTQENLYFSRVNLTASPTDGFVGDFRTGRIEEFYINRRTNNMVFSINFRGFLENSFKVYFRFFRSGREPFVILSEAGQIFPSVTFTTIIPNIDDLQLEKAEITAYTDALPAFYLGPELLNSTDPTVLQSVVEFLADIPTDIQELLLTDSQFYPPAYIQYNICDFGLRVVPVD